MRCSIFPAVGVTGALHLDGLADACDGGVQLQAPLMRRLEIMKTSTWGLRRGRADRRPPAGVRVAERVDGEVRWAALAAAPMMGRWSIVYALHRLPVRAAGRRARA